MSKTKWRQVCASRGEIEKKQAGVKTENPTLDDPHVVDGSIFSDSRVRIPLQTDYTKESKLYLHRRMSSSPKSTSTTIRHMLTRLRPKPNINISAINSVKVPQAPLVS